MLMSHTWVPCFLTFCASMLAYLVCWQGSRGERGWAGGKSARGLLPCAAAAADPLLLLTLCCSASWLLAVQVLLLLLLRPPTLGSSQLTGCHMRKAEPKQAEKVASGSVTPCSVPATLAV